MEISVIVLGIVIIGQAIERYFYAKDMNQRVADSMTALISRNANEFMAVKAVDKAVKETKLDSDEVELSNASDDVFDKFISSQNKV